MFYGEEDSSFQNLPPEMIVEVLSLVDLKGKLSARLVCRRWRWILDHPDLELVCFKLKNRKMTENSIQCLLKSELHIDHLELKNVKVTWPVMTYSRNKFPPIRQLTLGSGNSDLSLTTSLQYGCAQTESLTLDFRCLNSVRLDILSRVLSGIRWNQLAILNIKVELHPGKNNVKGMELFLYKARIPNLRALSLDLISFGTDEFHVGITKLMSNFADFLEHHSKTLKELRLCFFLCTHHEEVLVIAPNISPPLFSAEQKMSIARDLKLECLDISTTYFDGLVQLVPPCVLESENLTKLNWCPMWDLFWLDLNPISTTRPGAPEPLQGLIRRNHSTLTSVAITFVRGDIDPFELSWLESCTHLLELTIEHCDKFLGVKLQFPTVRKLGIVIVDFDAIENMSTWISRTFRNLKTVNFSVRYTLVVENLQFYWIQNLLVLQSLGEIRFGFTYYKIEKSYYENYDFIGPNLIRQYCSDKGRLMFKAERQRGRLGLLRSDPCLIKILPI